MVFVGEGFYGDQVLAQTAANPSRENGTRFLHRLLTVGDRRELARVATTWVVESGASHSALE